MTIAIIDMLSMEQMLDWLTNSPGQILAAICDFAILTVLIYGLLYFLRGTRSANVLFGITVFLLLAGMLAKQLHFFVVDTLLTWLWPTLGMAIIIIFQPEIRRLFAQAGSVFSRSRGDREAMNKCIDEVISAVVQMAENRVGALIVFERNIGLGGIVKTSVALEAKVSNILLQTIFFKNSPLHDCAVVIRKNYIVAARAVLPLMDEDAFVSMARSFGTRHRAALGITEETDAVALVVSEETGSISLAFKGKLVRDYTAEDLKTQLSRLLIEKGDLKSLFKHAPKDSPEARQGDLFDVDDEIVKSDKKETRS